MRKSRRAGAVRPDRPAARSATGWSSADTARQIECQLSEFLPRASVAATGYGRVCVPCADCQITEITCHARGACALYHEKTMSVIDIGGQDTKVICVEDGRVADFLMNDKCSAGTGRFLDVMAGSLGLAPEQLYTLAAGGGGVHISSMCTVFAESEVISLIGRGAPGRKRACMSLSQSEPPPGIGRRFFLYASSHSAYRKKDQPAAWNNRLPNTCHSATRWSYHTE